MNIRCFVTTRFAEYHEGLPTLRASGADAGGGSEGIVCMRVFPSITGALCANSHPGSYTGQDAFNNMLPVIERDEGCTTGLIRGSPDTSMGGAASSLLARDFKDAKDLVQEDNMETKQRKYVLRRLTPTECARLQGFPDWWCDGADGSDSAQYKLWGNGVALPCVADILGRVAKALRSEDK